MFSPVLPFLPLVTVFLFTTALYFHVMYTYICCFHATFSVHKWVSLWICSWAYIMRKSHRNTAAEPLNVCFMVLEISVCVIFSILEFYLIVQRFTFLLPLQLTKVLNVMNVFTYLTHGILVLWTSSLNQSYKHIWRYLHFKVLVLCLNFEFFWH